MTPEELEAAIAHQAMLLCYSESRDVRRAAMDELKRLHPLRNPYTIARLERERGLRQADA